MIVILATPKHDCKSNVFFGRISSGRKKTTLFTTIFEHGRIQEGLFTEQRARNLQEDCLEQHNSSQVAQQHIGSTTAHRQHNSTQVIRQHLLQHNSTPRRGFKCQSQKSRREMKKKKKKKSRREMRHKRNRIGNDEKLD